MGFTCQMPLSLTHKFNLHINKKSLIFFFFWVLQNLVRFFSGPIVTHWNLANPKCPFFCLQILPAKHNIVWALGKEVNEGQNNFYRPAELWPSDPGWRYGKGKKAGVEIEYALQIRDYLFSSHTSRTFNSGLRIAVGIGQCFIFRWLSIQMRIQIRRPYGRGRYIGPHGEPNRSTRKIPLGSVVR